MALTDSNGNVVETYEYDVFGMPDITQNGATNNRFLFGGWEWDTDTTLYNYDDVDYDPVIARLVQTVLRGCDTFTSSYLYGQPDVIAGFSDWYRCINKCEPGSKPELTDIIALATGDYNANQNAAEIGLSILSTLKVIEVINFIASILEPYNTGLGSVDAVEKLVKLLTKAKEGRPYHIQTKIKYRECKSRACRPWFWKDEWDWTYKETRWKLFYSDWKKDSLFWDHEHMELLMQDALKDHLEEFAKGIVK